MLEVLDPEQNHTFQDHYLEVDYDLSQVMFITTANVRYNIPLPLQDRMEIIELTSYLELDKLEIAKRHIIPKQVRLTGLEEKKVVFDDDSVRKIIRSYTREAGVRNLEREIASLLRKVAKDVVLQNDKLTARHRKEKNNRITTGKVETLLGVPKYKSKLLDKKNRIGSAVGLAWTSVGGELLTVDVSIMKGTGKLLLTGQLGEVMKESAMAALSCLRSNPKQFDLKEDFQEGKEVHIHLPEGAIPKDGPSAGITMTMAMLSAFSGRETAFDVAMTGEITLRGNVLPIGGLTEKLLAAKRNEISTVLIPKDNEVDLSEIPENIKSALTIVPVSTIEDALPYVFPNSKRTKKAQNYKL
jgi:ATP-dependent Lon protease